MGCRGVPILLLRLLSCFVKTSADFWSLNGSSIRTGCSTDTTGGGLETFDSLDLMKDKIVESTSSFGYFSLEKIDLNVYIQPQKVLSLMTNDMHDIPLFSKARFCTYNQRGCENVEVSQYL